VLTVDLSASSDLRSISFSRSTTVRTLFPDCLPLDDDITHLSFDERSPAVLRVGCSNGSIACVRPSPSFTTVLTVFSRCRTGNLSRSANENTYFPNDEEGWRTSWYLPSKITSLQTCGDRVLFVPLLLLPSPFIQNEIDLSLSSSALPVSVSPLKLSSALHRLHLTGFCHSRTAQDELVDVRPFSRSGRSR
jgi:hypothetical protein